MFNSLSSKILNRYSLSVAGIKLDEEQFLEDQFAELASYVDFRSFKPPELLKIINDKIRTSRKQYIHIAIWTSLPMILLFLSIAGVKIQISLLGIKLNQIENVKEVILIVTVVSSILQTFIADSIEELEYLRKQIFIRKYGEKQYEAIRMTFSFNYDSAHGMRFLNSKKYDVIGLKYVIEMTWLLTKLFSIVVIIGVISFVLFTVCKEIWTNPTFHPLISKTLVVISSIIYFMELLINLLKKSFKFRYIDRNKLDNNPILDKNTNELNETIVGMLKNAVFKQQKSKDRFYTFFFACVGLFGLYLWYFNN